MVHEGGIVKWMVMGLCIEQNVRWWYMKVEYVKWMVMGSCTEQNVCQWYMKVELLNEW